MGSDKSDSKRLADSLCHGNNPTSWNGPDTSYDFNGFESSVVVYICDGHLSIQTMARARQLLIIVTHGEAVNNPKNYDGVFKPMNNSVEKGFVRKMGDTPKPPKTISTIMKSLTSKFTKVFK